MLQVLFPHSLRTRFIFPQEWRQEIDLGFHYSGSRVSVEVIDSDSGLEFGDDLLYSVNVTVPWCSAFHADTAAADCEEDYAYECDVWVRTAIADGCVASQRVSTQVSFYVAQSNFQPFQQRVAMSRGGAR